jgi:hypothetical protein
MTRSCLTDETSCCFTDSILSRVCPPAHTTENTTKTKTTTTTWTVGKRVLQLLGQEEKEKEQEAKEKEQDTKEKEESTVEELSVGCCTDSVLSRVSPPDEDTDAKTTTRSVRERVLQLLGQETKETKENDQETKEKEERRTEQNYRTEQRAVGWNYKTPVKSESDFEHIVRLVVYLKQWERSSILHKANLVSNL